ncbi:unnamed protein product, partial [Hapterophycus canaliculatus]
MNVSIATARIRMSHAETREAIILMHDEALSPNILQLLQMCMPTKDEENKLLSFNGDQSKLRVTEK